MPELRRSLPDFTKAMNEESEVAMAYGNQRKLVSQAGVRPKYTDYADSKLETSTNGLNSLDHSILLKSSIGKRVEKPQKEKGRGFKHRHQSLE
jgi:hypothetical protein